MLFPLFLIFALLIISSVETGNEQLDTDTQSSQSIAIQANSACILTELSFSLKDNAGRLTFYSFALKNHLENRKRSRIDLLANDLQLYRRKTIVFIPLIQRLFLQLLQYSFDNEDDISS